MISEPFHFLVLPIHPQAYEGESLTSYLIRLGELNGIKSVDGLSTILFPYQSRRITRELADFPPLSLEDLAVAAQTSAEGIKELTFLHLGLKFGRSAHPQAQSRFLSGSLASSLRFCPSCLAETRFYRLIWRFLKLSGCSKHNCELLDECCHCHNPIPLFKAPLKIGFCPECGDDLSKCYSPPLISTTYRDAQNWCDLLRYFLTRSEWEQRSREIIKSVGKEFGRTRIQRSVSGVETANLISVTHTIIEGIERGNVMSRGGTFSDYVQYAEFLGVSLMDIFNRVTHFSAVCTG